MLSRLFLILVIGGSVPLAECIASDRTLTYEADIRSIFREHCFDCHGAEDEKQGGLDLRQVRLMRLGGDSGPAIAEEQTGESLLLQRIQNGEMPPGDSKVSEDQIAVLERAKVIR